MESRQNAKARARLWVSTIAIAVSVVSPVRAQCTPLHSHSVSTLAGSLTDSARLGHLLGSCWGDAALIRSSLRLPREREGQRWDLLDPVVMTKWNSEIPVSLNDGAMWAGRGLSFSIVAGAEARIGRLRVVIAPEMVTSGNAAFGVISANNPDRSPYSSPFHGGVFSADLPLRFGFRRYSRVLPGESAAEISFGPLASGVTSASQWWGPGVRNALVMSNNAAGIPQLFLRTRKPIPTRFGDVEGHLFIGQLTESPFFDSDPRNDQRAISAGVVTLRTSADTGLVIGMSRAVYATAANLGAIAPHAIDALIDWSRASSTDLDASDQITSLFGQWVFPTSGFGIHAEWGILRLPKSTRDLLVRPQLFQGYTLGLEWARSVFDSGTVRVVAEATMLEQTPEVPGSDAPEFYTSRSVRQGYTQLGESVGAAIGPGSSSQHIGIDYFHRRWQLGASVGRIRWEEGAYYRSRAAYSHFGHDISLYAALNGRWDSRRLQIDTELMRTKRLSYLFQIVDPFWYDSAFDIRNVTLRLRLTPHF